MLLSVPEKGTNRQLLQNGMFKQQELIAGMIQAASQGAEHF